MAKKRSERHVRQVAATLDVPSAVALAATATSATGGLRDVQTPAATTGQDGSEEYGASGTFNYSGYISGEDYNPKLDGLSALDIFDEMRRSDAQVRASLLALKLPLKAATWTIQPPKDGDEQDRAIADFVQLCLLDDDAMTEPWMAALGHMLLSLDFGFAVHEKVWTIGEAGEARLARLAPRLPRTIHRWIQDPLGRLLSVVQFAPKDGRYGYLTIPGDNCLVISREKEGDNWYGRSVLRTAYMHWFYKTQAYRIAGVALDRLGIGIPRARITQEFGSDEKAIRKVEATLKGLRTHDRAYVVEKPGLQYDFLMPEGGKSMAVELPAVVDHHNTMIARNVLAGFLAQQESQYGSRATTETLADLLLACLHGESATIASAVKQAIIRPLCDLNFNMAGRQYPSLSASNLARMDLDKMAARLKALVDGKLLTPDDEMEEHLRDVEGLPPMPDDTKGRRQAARENAPMPPGPGTQETKEPAADPDPSDPTRPKAVEGDPQLRLRKARYTESGRTFSREPNAFERQILLTNVPRWLDDAQARLLATLTEIRQRQLKQFAARLATKDASPTAAFTDFRPRSVGPMPFIAEMRRAIRATQAAMFTYGQQTVVDELRQQGATIRAAKQTASENVTVAKSALVTSAQITAQKLADLWRSRILETATRLRRTGLQGDALVDAIYRALLEEAETGARREAAAEVNEAVAIGRQLAAYQNEDEIEKVIYSCLLDENSCPVCESWDGREMQIGDADYLACLPPNQACDGNKGAPDACRCVLLYIYKQRTAAAAGPEGVRA